MTNRYSVNVGKLAVQLLPMCLRGDRMKAFVKAMVEPLKDLIAAFTEFRGETDYRLTHNSQVCYLRAVLNDRFDPLLRGIQIKDANRNLEGVIIHSRETESPVVLSPTTRMILYRRNFGGSRSVAFRVGIPYRLHDRIDMYELAATINKYKLASLRYQITYRYGQDQW